jgi:radical SAM-linked protein
MPDFRCRRTGLSATQPAGGLRPPLHRIAGTWILPYRIALQFAVRGDLRFLSHQDSMKVFERAAVRAGLPLRFSGGFNPHARMSLPMPRPVGVASDDDLLVLDLGDESANIPADLTPLNVLDRLAAQFPADGCVVLRSARAVAHVPQAKLVHYGVNLTALSPADRAALPSRIAAILAADQCVVHRRIDAEGTDRPTDIRPYLRDVQWDASSARLAWSLAVTPAGTARPGELLAALEIEPTPWIHRVVRERIEWEENNTPNSLSQPSPVEAGGS